MRTRPKVAFPCRSTRSRRCGGLRHSSSLERTRWPESNCTVVRRMLFRRGLSSLVLGEGVGCRYAVDQFGEARPQFPPQHVFMDLQRHCVLFNALHGGQRISNPESSPDPKDCLFPAVPIQQPGYRNTRSIGGAALPEDSHKENGGSTGILRSVAKPQSTSSSSPGHSTTRARTTTRARDRSPTRRGVSWPCGFVMEALLRSCSPKG